jgi:DNA-binding HxlR family transcriptional regulator
LTHDCTLYRTVNLFSKRWTLLIILELAKGRGWKRRYSELKRGLSGITPKILSQRLKELEKEGLVKKEVDTRVMPVKCEYCLTEPGRDFFGILREMKEWGLRWKFSDQVCESQDCRDCSLQTEVRRL